MTERWLPATSLCAMIYLAHSARAEPAAAVGAHLPTPVTAFVKRRMDCDHWMGEDAYDAARGRDIAAAVKALRCDAVEADEKRLRQRHRRDPAVLHALDRAPPA